MTIDYSEQSLSGIIRYNKLEPLKQSIDQLTQEIDVRRQMRDQNLESIEAREIELDTLIMRLGQIMRFDYGAFLTSKSRQTFDRGISDLKTDQANELRSYWKDVIDLKQELQGQIAEYQKAKMLLGGLTGPPVDAPSYEQTILALPEYSPPYSPAAMAELAPDQVWQPNSLWRSR